MEFVLKKELGVQMINGEEFKQVEKYHFFSAWECEKKFKELDDNNFVILMRKSVKWLAITLEELSSMADKVKSRLRSGVKFKKENNPRINIEYYAENPVERWRFTGYCKRNNLDFNSFEEIAIKQHGVTRYLYKHKNL